MQKIITIIIKKEKRIKRRRKCEHQGRSLSGFGHQKSNTRTHNEGRVTEMRSALMQIDPQRPECKSPLITLFTTP